MPREATAMTEGNVTATLLRLAMPMVFGAFSIVAYTLVDTYFVGRLGPIALATIGFAFPVLMLTSGIGIGVGIGASAVASRALGRGDRDHAATVTLAASLLSVLVTASLGAAGYLTIDPLFRMLGAEQAVLDQLHGYMAVWYAGLPFVMAPIMFNAILQATGDTVVPAITMTSGVLLSIGLDPLLIFGWGPVPALGVQGAAYATVCARSATVVLPALVLFRRERLLRLQGATIAGLVRATRQVLFIAVPAAATQLVQPLAMGILTALVAWHGTEAVAGFGVGTRLEMFALIVMMAMSMVMTPFVGQNASGGRLDRVRAVMNAGNMIVCIWGFIVFLIALLFAPPIARVFNDTAPVVDTAASYLRLVSISYGLQGVVMLVGSAFNGQNQPYSATALAFVRVLAFILPMAYLGERLHGLVGIFIGVAVANILAGVLSLWWFGRNLKKITRSNADPAAS